MLKNATQEKTWYPNPCVFKIGIQCIFLKSNLSQLIIFITIFFDKSTFFPPCPSLNFHKSLQFCLYHIGRNGKKAQMHTARKHHHKANGGLYCPSFILEGFLRFNTYFTSLEIKISFFKEHLERYERFFLFFCISFNEHEKKNLKGTS